MLFEYINLILNIFFVFLIFFEYLRLNISEL